MKTICPKAISACSIFIYYKRYEIWYLPHLENAHIPTPQQKHVMSKPSTLYMSVYRGTETQRYRNTHIDICIHTLEYVCVFLCVFLLCVNYVLVFVDCDCICCISLLFICNFLTVVAGKLPWCEITPKSFWWIYFKKFPCIVYYNTQICVCFYLHFCICVQGLQIFCLYRWLHLQFKLKTYIDIRLQILSTITKLT